jgi:sterol 3beta-glucosyltransferase
MNILILTIGTRGDVMPFVALGEGLKAAGHDVSVCSSIRYESAIRERGLSYNYLSDELVALVETPDGRAAIAGAGGMISGAGALLKLMRTSMRIQRELMDDGWTAAKETAPDLIIYHPKMSIALHYAQKLRIPALMGSLFPVFLPTSAYPNPGFPELGLGNKLAPIYNRTTHRLIRGVVSFASRWLFRSWRKAHDLPARPFGRHLLQHDDGRTVPLLNAWSTHIAPDPPEWQHAEICTTGFWFLKQDDDWKPSAGLRAFLDEGPPPVYIGFGSMAGRKPEETTSLVLKALHDTGLRAVLTSGWGGLRAANLPDSVYMLDEAPHDWLFPRMAAVVHHGGAGTTAAGIRAGCPTVICPFFGDQPFWGKRVFESELGPEPIPQKRLNAELLTAALKEATQNPAIQDAASKAGEKLRNEDGVRNAVQFIEQYAERFGDGM